MNQKHSNIALFLSLVFPVLASQPRAENWPAWRGPRGDGTSLETNLPARWNSTENIVWKTAVPGVGHSSPIVWGDRIFMATAFPENEERALLCFDRSTGRML